MEYFDNHKSSSKFAILRAIIIFLLAIWAMLAMGTEMMDVFSAYLNLNISPDFALALGIGVYWMVLVLVTVDKVFPGFEIDGKFNWVIVSIAVIFGIFLLMLAFDVWYVADNVQRLPGELERHAAILRVFVWVIIIASAYVTAKYDYERNRR